MRILPALRYCTLLGVTALASENMIRNQVYLTGFEVRAFTIQIAGTTIFLHSKGMTHWDLKPSIIGVDANMDIKTGLLDLPRGCSHQRTGYLRDLE
jgi:serine/threonine protein kinase